jgi:hypothetical protein
MIMNKWMTVYISFAHDECSSAKSVPEGSDDAWMLLVIKFSIWYQLLLSYYASWTLPVLNTGKFRTGVIRLKKWPTWNTWEINWHIVLILFKRNLSSHLISSEIETSLDSNFKNCLNLYYLQQIWKKLIE